MFRLHIAEESEAGQHQHPYDEISDASGVQEAEDDRYLNPTGNLNLIFLNYMHFYKNIMYTYGLQ